MKKVFFLLTLLWLSHTGWAQTAYQPTVENRKAREQFQDEKFGIFLHWGLYSMLARGEWVMHNEVEMNESHTPVTIQLHQL